MRQFGKKSVFWKWIISYISVILVMVVCNTITYLHNWKIMEEHQSKMNQMVLEQLSERLYDNILQLERIRERILTNSHYIFLCRAGTEQYLSLAYRRYMLCNELRVYQAMSNECSKIIVYFEDGDYIISTDNVSGASLYWSVFKDELGIEQAEWEELLTREYPALETREAKFENGQGMICARTVQSGQTGYQRINVLFLYTPEDIREMLATHQNEESYSAALFGKDDAVIMMDIGDLLTEEEERKAVQEAVSQGLRQTELQNGDKITLTYNEETLPRLCLISSSNIYMESIQQIQQIYVLTFAVTIVFSMGLIVLYARRNYKPLKELLDVLEPEEWVSVNYKNEFAMVKDKVFKVQNENRNVNLTLRRQNKLFRAEYFAKLLTGNSLYFPKEHLEQFYDISFISDIFAVMLFYVESYEEEREEGAELNRAQFILGNVFGEILEELSCKIYQTRISDLMVLIVNLPAEAADRREIFDKTIKRGTEFINQYFNMGYSVTISNVHEEKAGLAAAYQEALQAMEYKRLYGLDDMYYNSIIDMSGAGYYYPIDVEQELMRHIQESDFEAAKAVYQHVVEENRKDGQIVSQDRLRCLMYDLLGTVLKTLDENSEDETFARELKPARRLAACQGLTQMKEELEDILFKTCEYLKGKAKAEDKETLCGQIQDYIRKNYCDPNLSVTSIAEHFSLPPVMMSKMFRETVGEKIPVVVSEVRLEAAKKLMCQSGESLGDIAERAGFGSVRTFTRIFKQIENCTPGQWRELHS